MLADSQDRSVAGILRLDRLPKLVTDALISNGESLMISIKEQQRPGETKLEHAFKEEAADEIARRFTSLVKDAKQLGFHLNVDRNAREFSVEVGVAGKPGSTLEATIMALGAGQSLFADLLKPDAAMNLLAHAAVPESIHKAFGPVIDEHIRAGEGKLPGEIADGVFETNQRRYLRLIIR